MIAFRIMDEPDRQEVMRTFGERLRALRRQKGLTQEALALLCGLDQTYVSGIERGLRNVSLVNIHRIARTLELSPKDFFE